jgi:hypothetical protein
LKNRQFATRYTFVLSDSTFVGFSKSPGDPILGLTEDTKMYIDNRDAGQMYDYLESRIEALKKRISELECENERLREMDLEPEFAHS